VSFELFPKNCAIMVGTVARMSSKYNDNSKDNVHNAIIMP